MEKVNETTSIVDAQSNDELANYFSKAGAFGYVGIMLAFYAILLVIFFFS